MEFSVLAEFSFLGWVCWVWRVWHFDFVFCLLRLGIWRFGISGFLFGCGVDSGTSECFVVFGVGIARILRNFGISGEIFGCVFGFTC